MWVKYSSVNLNLPELAVSHYIRRQEARFDDAKNRYKIVLIPIISQKREFELKT